MTRLRLTGSILALLLLASACGSDDGDTAASADADGTASADQADDTSDGDGGSDDDGDGDDGGAADTTTTEPITGDSGSDWCGRVRSIADSDEPSPLNFNFLGQSPDQLRQQFEANLEVFEEWGDVAPPEIDDDVDLILATYRTFVDMGNEADWNIQVMSADPAFNTAFDDDAVDAAGSRIDAYTTDVCGVDLGAAAQAPGPATGSSDGDDGDIVGQLLAALGLPAAAVPEQGRVCMNEILADSGTFPDAIGPGYIPSAADLDALNEAGTACGITAFG